MPAGLPFRAIAGIHVVKGRGLARYLKGHQCLVPAFMPFSADAIAPGASWAICLLLLLAFAETGVIFVVVLSCFAYLLHELRTIVLSSGDLVNCAPPDYSEPCRNTLNWPT
ncbi:hypothetical protein AXG93_1660s1020 [Marchantia polymorpha subsp. ruderalis]|uniref:Uncharacterized protein n=1 Tax=Marchantia polymorpha subsp. ruderalis TaxID=1480154 RepID=A0A176VR18_MARPO|nr:hypothetical protein AXG93_1660s1020 [Marchantia polymorpha subsp. ruderalis]